ncbi:alpha-glucosidase (family GH31 glycosyl hydrolase) [Luteibacter sp. OK325]|uniref:glycoside hydrolase family 31 protein n=1 Tax=Luteibacter sp. OK325 TaxID=2135670 RepID=UPI000D3C544E|nr:glycoside hydrolase family 31 protein [Luteibacter sp. OK325]PTR34129.1 alpha-glucosidase (family GH31 glycosyl hydrolase) [Luteibacter sp. OK325]
MTLVRKILFSAVFLLICICAPAAQAASPSVVSGSARFTVLTPRVIRMEYAKEGHFEDAPSLVFATRNDAPAVDAKVSHEQGWLVIRTSDVTLRYKEAAGVFTADNLSIASSKAKPAFTWHPGQKDTANLGGTARTLDQVDGDRHAADNKPLDLGDGLLSRDGWHVVDDTGSFVFGNEKLPWVHRRACQDCTDWTFFGYGHDYTAALRDFALLAGREPLPPRYAFGYWWSRYWNYSDSELRDVVADFVRYRIPLDVLVIDMDWHRTDGLSSVHPQNDVNGQTKGWTGFTWNRALFPEPERLLQWLRDQGLKVTLNLHPASGILPHEESYGRFMGELKADPAKPLAFEAADPAYMAAFFHAVLDPLQHMGVSFWWLDWQQWRESKALPGLSNTWWLNHVFFTHMQQQGEKRALIYHRWGGLGNHRYQIGFSGDSIISWGSLAFQPRFTATASNVLYGYWSHDLGGHTFRDESDPATRRIDPELYIRWMQFGAYSPIMRTHTTKNPDLRKEPSRFAPAQFDALRETVLTRYTLLPYTYTMGRKAFDTGVSLVRPMYYAWPDEDKAYQSNGQYMFGDDLLVAPVTATAGDGGFAKQDAWLPKGDWFDVTRGRMLHGGRTVSARYRLDEVPVFARAGAIVPTNSDPTHSVANDDGARTIVVYPRKNQQAELYEDAGDDEGYRGKAFARTALTTEWSKQAVRLRIAPREGQYAGMASTRRWSVAFVASAMPSRVTVDGQTLQRVEGDAGLKPGTWRLEGRTLTLRLALPEHDFASAQVVDVTWPSDAPDVDGLAGEMRDVREAVEWLKGHWTEFGGIPDELSEAAQADRLIDYHPERFVQEVAAFRARVRRLDASLEEGGVPADVRKQFGARMR